MARTVDTYLSLMRDHVAGLEERNGLFYPQFMSRNYHPLGGFKSKMEALETAYVYLRENGRI